MTPPYEITQTVLSLVAAISEKLGSFNAARIVKPSPELRRANRIKTVAASLAIEGNSFGEEEILAILENRQVLGPAKDVQEVRNAIEAYDQLRSFEPGNLGSFLEAHGILMRGLVDDPGSLRSGKVGILKGSKVAHVAPPAKNLPRLMDDLFAYVASDELALVKSCVAHYEIEFIHPFMDGNGRMGRLWQSVILARDHDVFEYLPFETVIKNEQAEYYRILGECDKAGNSTAFIEFILDVINRSLEELVGLRVKPLTPQDRVLHFLEKTDAAVFTRKEYLALFRDISTATASRDLKYGVQKGLLIKQGDGRNAAYTVNGESSATDD